MPRGSKNDYEVVIPVRIKNEAASGTRGVKSSVDKMLKDQLDAVEKANKAQLRSEKQAALESARIQKQKEAEINRSIKAQQVEHTRMLKQRMSAVEQANRAELRSEQQKASAVQSLQRQRSTALIAGWRKEQDAFAHAQEEQSRLGRAHALRRQQSEEQSWTIIRNVALGTLIAIGIGIAGLTSAVERAATFQRLEQGLAAMMGSAEAAREEIVKLKEVAKVPGLGFREAIQGSLALQSLGFNADRARKTLQQFANAVAFTGGKEELQRVMVQLTQMTSAGKVIMQDLRPILQTAPVAGRALRDVFGTISPKELNEKTKSIEEFIDKWVAGLEKLPRAPDAAANAFENLSDSWDRFMIAVGTPFLPLVSGSLNILAPLLEKTGNALGSMLSIFMGAPSVLGLATAAVTAFTLALMFSSTTAIPASINAAKVLITQVRLVGQVMMGTASLIQGAAATNIVWAAGWVGVGLAIAGAIYWLTKAEDSIGAANKITVDQIEHQGKEVESAKALAAEGRELSAAYAEHLPLLEASADRHEKLNTILERLDPTTRAYIESLTTEGERLDATNAKLKERIELSQGQLQANAIVLAASIRDQETERAYQERYVAEQENIIRVNKENDDLVLRASANIVEHRATIDGLNKSLTENYVKLVTNAKARGLSQEAFVAEIQAAQLSADKVQLLSKMYQDLTPKVNTATDAMKEQAKAVEKVAEELKDLLHVGDAEIESHVLDIVKGAKTAAEARKMAQEALKGDQTFRELLQKRKTAGEAEKAAREVFEPKPITKAATERGTRDAEMIASMREAANELAADFQEEFGRAMKFHFGQTGLHTKLNYDHRAAFDVSENPLAAEGQFVLQWLEAHGINARASLGREISKTTGKLISSGPHIHGGELSGGIGRGLKINEGLLSPKALARAMEEEALVFAPWSGQMVTQKEYNIQRAAMAKKNQQLEAPDITELAQMPPDVEKAGELFYQRTEERNKDLIFRLKHFWTEYFDTRKNMEIDLGHIQADLDQQRQQNADQEFVDLRQQISVKSEELQLTRAITEAQDEQATSGYNESLRIQLALIQDINNMRRRDEEAIKDYNKAVLEMADANVYHAQQADTTVARFLAGQKSVTEIVADAKIGVMQVSFDLMDRGLSKITNKLGIMSDLVHEIISGFLRLAVSQFFKTIFLGQGGPAGGAGGAIGSIFGGGGGGAGGAGVQGIGAAVGGALRNAFVGSGAVGPGGGIGIAAPASVTGMPSALNPSQIASMTSGLSPLLAGGKLGAGGFLKSIGPMLPLLGLGAGSQLGGQSGLGSILGGVGGLLAGGAGAALLAPGMFATTGVFGSLGPAISGLLTNPFTIAAAGALIVGALIAKKNAQRRADEKKRNEISTNTGTAIWALIDEARLGDITSAAANSRWNEIAANYAQQTAQIKDGKTRRNAELQWKNDFLPLKNILDQAVAGSVTRANIRARMVPVFDGGGVSHADQLIRVRPGEGIRYPGANVVHAVFGKDLGYDSQYMYAPRGTRIINQSEMKQSKPFQMGGTVGGNQTTELPTLEIQSLGIEIDADGLAKVVIKSTHFKKAVIRNVKVGKLDKKIA